MRDTNKARWYFTLIVLFWCAIAALTETAKASSWTGPVVIEMNVAGSPVPESAMVTAIGYAAWSWSERTGVPISYAGTTDATGTTGRITIVWGDLPFVNIGNTLPYKITGTDDRARATITLNRNRFTDTIDDCDIESIVHEVGHAMGISGHGTAPDDVMYSNRGTCRPALSAADVAMLPYQQNTCFTELTPGFAIESPNFEGRRVRLDHAGLADGRHRWTVASNVANATPKDCSAVQRRGDGTIKLDDVRSQYGRWSAELQYTQEGYVLTAATQQTNL